MDDAAVAAEIEALTALAWGTLTSDERRVKRIEARGGRATFGQRRRAPASRADPGQSHLEVEETLRGLAERLARSSTALHHSVKRRSVFIMMQIAQNKILLSY